MTESDIEKKLYSVWPEGFEFGANTKLVVKVVSEIAQEARKEVLDLPCMQEEEVTRIDRKVGDDYRKEHNNDLRREIRDALQSNERTKLQLR